VDHGPIKVEWSLTGSDNNWRTETGDQRGVNGSLKFLSKYSAAVPSSPPRTRHNDRSQI
jgi:hypothetical protein